MMVAWKVESSDVGWVVHLVSSSAAEMAVVMADMKVGSLVDGTVDQMDDLRAAEMVDETAGR
jgi:hypothetical protein